MTFEGKPMTTFTIERSYLVPVYQHITVEAGDVTGACAAALDEDAHPWDNDKVDYESARETTVTGAWTGPAAYEGPSLLADLPDERETGAAERFAFACPHCASTNLTWDAITRWDVTSQTNIVVTLLDTGSCEDCCAELKQAERVPLGAEHDR